MSNDNKLSRGLDEPIPIFFFDPVDFVLMVTFFGMGIVTKQLELGIILSWSVLKISKAMRKGAKRGVMPHFLWKIGVLPDAKLSNYDPLKTDFTK